MSIGGGGSGGYGMAGTGYLSTASSQDGGLLRYAFHLHISANRGGEISAEHGKLIGFLRPIAWPMKRQI